MEVSDWSSKDSFSDDDLPDFSSEEIPEEDFEPSEPYTLHRHPVYIVTKALFVWMRSTFENYLESSVGKQATSKLTWKYATVLQEAEHQAIMGIQAIDMADYGLAICHFKRALTAINLTMSTLSELLVEKPDSKYREEIYARLLTSEKYISE